MSKLSGKIAVVTGGTGALGRIVVEFLLREGATVIVTHTGKIESINFLAEKRKLYTLLESQIVDVCDEESVSKFFQSILKKHRAIDILCNLVGGVQKKNNIEDTTAEDWSSILRLNLQSCFFMTKFAVRSMKVNGFGRIFNIGSMAALKPEAQRGGYGVAKAGVIALTRTVAEEVAERGNITVNVIIPSIILTEANKQWGTPEEMKQWVTPEEIAEKIVVLCDESSKTINGQIIQMYGKV